MLTPNAVAKSSQQCKECGGTIAAGSRYATRHTYGMYGRDRTPERFCAACAIKINEVNERLDNLRLEGFPRTETIRARTHEEYAKANAELMKAAGK